MNKIYLVSCLLLCNFVSASYAGDIKVTSLQSTWGMDDKKYYCAGSGTEAGFSSTDASGESVIGTDSKWSKYLVDNWTYAGGTNGRDGFNAIYYLASARYSHGYKFCKTVVAADRWGDATMTRVEFYKPSTEDCFTLCESGYYGPACVLRTPLKQTTSIEQFKTAEALSTGAVHKLANNDRSTNDADVLRLDLYWRGCSGNKQIDLKLPGLQEHKVVLALKKITTETNAMTFTIQPMIVRAGAQPGFWLASAKGYKYAWPMVKFQGTEKTNYCPSVGFIYENGKCVVDEHAQNYQALQAAIEKAREEERKNRDLICPDWSDKLRYYDNTQHIFIDREFSATDATNCKIFKCADETKGFNNTRQDYDSASATSPYACVSCDVAAPEGGNAALYAAVHGVDKTGACIKCDVGYFYKEESKTCEKAKVFDMRNMAYGPGKNNRDDLKLQCWTMADPKCYKACMEGVSKEKLKEDGCIQGDITNVSEAIQNDIDDRASKYKEQYNDSEIQVDFDTYTDTVTLSK